jgi:hypothetical protein
MDTNLGMRRELLEKSSSCAMELEPRKGAIIRKKKLHYLTIP